MLSKLCTISNWLLGIGELMEIDRNFATDVSGVILQRALMLMWRNRLSDSKVCLLVSMCGLRCCNGLCSLHRPAAYLLGNLACW